MGLDARVRCNCRAEGRTPPLPFPEAWLTHDSAEDQLVLRPEHDTDANWHRLHEWERTACAHRGAWFEHVGNWGSVRAFQEAARRAGLTTLATMIPAGNGGTVSPEDARRALEELGRLDHLGERVFLVDAETGVELQGAIESYDGLFRLSGPEGIDVGLRPTELFVRDRATGQELFRSARFTQTRDGDRFVWTDVATGATFATRSPLAAWESEPARQLHVVQRPVTAADFGHVTEPLRRILGASEATGNPVVWS